MRRIVAILMMACMLTASWAAPASMGNRVDPAAVTVDVGGVQGVTLAELLSLLSERSGVPIAAAPEVAGLRVDIAATAGRTLAEVLADLGARYRLAYRLNDGGTAVIVLKAAEYEEQWAAAMPLGGRNVLEKSVALSGAAPSPGGGYYPPGPYGGEEYKRIYDGNYQDTATSPLSTFSIDVDTAAYSNVRRFLNSGRLPPPDAVRTEELVNYFTYDYRQPAGEHPFSVTAEVAACPWQPGHELVMIGLQGKNVPAEELPPATLVFLIDVSGSMASANKLPLLKTAFKVLVKQLRAEDTVAIVVYAGRAGVALAPTAGSEKGKIAAAIDNLQAGGSTAGGAGIGLAYKLAGENFREGGNNRVILATDGDFNVGPTSEGELTRLIEAKRGEGIFLSILGFGMGNLKDNRMEMLADRGNGMYAYIDSAQEARKVMVGQMAGTLYTIAQDVKLQVEFNPAKVKAYRLIGYENRRLADRDFNDDGKDAGDMGAGHAVTAFYEVIPAGAAEGAGAVDPLVYQKPVAVASDDLLQVKVRYKKPAGLGSILLTERVGPERRVETPSENFRFAAAVAEYALLLRDSEYKGQASYGQVLELAGGARGRDAEGYRGEFVRMVEITRLLADKE
ncbi:MAG: VWA domain-containing protein [Sporomusaceae bacterium]|nr:VWA domain-containing protein [Sporomusaceae bacterium]